MSNVVRSEHIKSQEEVERIHAAVSQLDFPTDIIKNDDEVSLAVTVRTGIDVTQLSGVIALHHLIEDYGYKEHGRVRDILPIQGSYLYPPRMLALFDAVIKAAVDDPAVLATRLRGGPDNENRPRVNNTDVGTHIDAGGTGRYGKEVLGGLTVHVTPFGMAGARFGRVNSFGDRLSLLTARREVREDLIREVCAPYTEMETLNPGDVVIFRGYADLDRGLLPVAHDFTTLSDERMRHIFSPRANTAEIVNLERSAVIQAYNLEHAGYKAA